MTPDLSVALTVYDDYDGAFFTLQSIRMHHSAFNFKIIVVDQNPESEYGKLLKSFVENIGGKYLPQTDLSGPSHGRNLCMETADTPWVLMMDCHVLLTPDALNHLRIAIETQTVLSSDLIHGPLLYDRLDDMASHWKPGWNEDCYGTWAFDVRASHEHGQPFEIPMSGVGLMVVNKDYWPTYNADFRGFGAEEWYLHRKYMLQGGRVMCIPGFRWMHRFGRMPHIKYNLNLENKLYNTFLGNIELGDIAQMETDKTYWLDRNERVTNKVLKELGQLP